MRRTWNPWAGTTGTPLEMIRLNSRTLLFGAAPAGALALFLMAGSATEATAAAPTGTRRYEVTITNTTRGQVMAPVAIAAHDATASLFELGQPASPGLALMAEEGDTSMLASELSANPGVLDVRSTGGLLMPGATTTMLVVVDDDHPYLSMAGMMVSTNDAFMAVRNLLLPIEGSKRTTAIAYDSGTEANSEDCTYIPGPPCGNGGAHDPAPAEGYVHHHAGVAGIGSLDASVRDWRGPVAEITVRRYNP